jgi:hypothetical protein
MGRGGMGVVYRARDRRLKRQVAVKVLPPELAYRAEIRTRFLREAETAAQLTHPHIVPIYAVDEADGLVFFVMACIDGENLGKRLHDRGPMPVDDVRRVLAEVADALAYAHARGVVHRDIKPDNILLDHDGDRAMVTDFGIARAVIEGSDARLTATGMAIGTPAYMSPEQSAGDREVDGRSDLYSLGVVAYQMLAGVLPFQATSTPAMLIKHLSERPVPVDQRRPDCPPDLAAAVMRMLEKDPAARFASADELEAVLLGQRAIPTGSYHTTQPPGARAGTAPLPPGPGGAPLAPAPAPPAAARTRRAARRVRRHRRLGRRRAPAGRGAGRRAARRRPGADQRARHRRRRPVRPHRRRAGAVGGGAGARLPAQVRLVRRDRVGAAAVHRPRRPRVLPVVRPVDAVHRLPLRQAVERRLRLARRDAAAARAAVRRRRRRVGGRLAGDVRPGQAGQVATGSAAAGCAARRGTSRGTPAARSAPAPGARWATAGGWATRGRWETGGASAGRTRRATPGRRAPRTPRRPATACARRPPTATRSSGCSAPCPRASASGWATWPARRARSPTRSRC